MINNLKLGQLGEDIAKKYLEERGYKILEQNCKNKYGEIDLVCGLPAGRQGDKNTIVFVEVKTRTGEQFGTPEDSLKRGKIKRLMKNAQAYMMGITKRNPNKPIPLPYRIDAICIVLEKGGEIRRLNHYENINVF